MRVGAAVVVESRAPVKGAGLLKVGVRKWSHDKTAIRSIAYRQTIMKVNHALTLGSEIIRNMINIGVVRETAIASGRNSAI